MTDIVGGINKANTTITSIEQALTALSPQIAAGEMLVSLGIASVERIHAYFASKVSDDEILAGIMSEVDARIARRG